MAVCLAGTESSKTIGDKVKPCDTVRSSEITQKIIEMAEVGFAECSSRSASMDKQSCLCSALGSKMSASVFCSVFQLEQEPTRCLVAVVLQILEV